VIKSQHLVIPHERMHERKFVLAPLAEILPNYIHPIFGVTVQKLLENCSDKSQVTLFKSII
jgi:2-amino-4-hydroxy-6-hydroxymethyldihydropteridine diphosphokinase